MRQLFLSIAIMFVTTTSYAQSILNRTVSVNMTRQRLALVLDNIAKQGNFHFSYIPDAISGDSIVTIKAGNRTVKQALDQLFQGSCQYREMGDQLILQRGSREKWFVVSGYIKDGTTGGPVTNASVYERVQLISAMTNDQGYFRLKLREKDQPPMTSITVSKDLYKDTVLFVSSGYDQEISTAIKPANPIQLSVVDVNQYTRVEQTWLGQLFLSSRQRVQSLNISDFFTRQPYQYSILPGAGTHGKMGSQVVNKISINMIGGYTAGLNGFEVASIFNIDKKDVQYVQIAGMFNGVGGNFKGAQISGLHNQTMGTLEGAQISGVSNILKNDLTGVQISSVYNKAISDTTEGGQISGLLNVHKGNIQGVQIAGLGNIDSGSIKGVQIAGIFNYTKVLKGVQIGLVNIADSSDGFSIGLLNIVKKGYHRLDIYNNELTDVNIAYRSGNYKFYSIITVGANLNSREKAYTFGGGFGHTFLLNKRLGLSLEFTGQAVYIGDWETTESINRIQSVFNYRLAKGITLFGGPTFSISQREANLPVKPVPGYRPYVPGRYRPYNWGDKTTAWFGWHVGIGFF